MNQLNSYISKDRTEFKDQDEFYGKSHEVVIKHKQLEVKGISYDLTLEYVHKGCLYHPK